MVLQILSMCHIYLFYKYFCSTNIVSLLYLARLPKKKSILFTKKRTMCVTRHKLKSENLYYILCTTEEQRGKKSMPDDKKAWPDCLTVLKNNEAPGMWRRGKIGHNDQSLRPHFWCWMECWASISLSVSLSVSLSLCLLCLYVLVSLPLYLWILWSVEKGRRCKEYCFFFTWILLRMWIR